MINEQHYIFVTYVYLRLGVLANLYGAATEGIRKLKYLCICRV